MTSGFGTAPILIIAGAVIAANLVIGMLMLSNKKTVSKVNSVSPHAHHEMQVESNITTEINNGKIQTK
jgi:hypothetical protein